MKQVTPKYLAWIAVSILLSILFIPPHHHHGGQTCFAADIYETHEGACADPEHHCDGVPDAADTCFVYLKSAFIQSSKAGQGDDSQYFPLLSLCLADGISVPVASEIRPHFYKPDQAFICYSPEQSLSRRGPPVRG